MKVLEILFVALRIRCRFILIHAVNELIDFKSHTVTFDGKAVNPVPYNLLVGVVGAKSDVLNAFVTQRGFDYQQTNMPNAFKVMYVPRTPELSEKAVHAFRWVCICKPSMCH